MIGKLQDEDLCEVSRFDFGRMNGGQKKKNNQYSVECAMVTFSSFHFDIFKIYSSVVLNWIFKHDKLKPPT